jgi:aspartokinase
MGKVKIGGIIQSKQLAQVGVISILDRPGFAEKIFAALGKEGNNIQLIVQSVDLDGRGNTAFCVDR